MDEHPRGGTFFNVLINRFKSSSKVPENIEQLQSVISNFENNAILPADVIRMLEGVLHVSEIRVADVMIPHSQMAYLDLNRSIEDNLDTICKTAHSRFPVVSESIDKVLGVLLAKDLLQWSLSGKQDNLSLSDMLRTVFFVPENKRLNTILQEFRDKQNHLAIVVDEYGNTAGMVTLEDVLEQIVGDIVDEHDIEDSNDILQHSNIRHTVKAQTTIEDFNEYFESDLTMKNVNTIGGFVTHSLGKMPTRNEVLKTDKFRFRVLRADKRQVRLLQVNLIDTDKNNINK